MNQMHSFFDGCGPSRGGPQGGPGGMMVRVMQAVRLIPQFMRDPIGAMMSCGLNIPRNVQGNPEGMVNYLMNSGQMTQEQHDVAEQCAQLAQQFIGKKS